MIAETLGNLCGTISGWFYARQEQKNYLEILNRRSGLFMGGVTNQNPMLESINAVNNLLTRSKTTKEWVKGENTISDLRFLVDPVEYDKQIRRKYPQVVVAIYTVEDFKVITSYGFKTDEEAVHFKMRYL